jgi:hypothetical protein
MLGFKIDSVLIKREAGIILFYRQTGYIKSEAQALLKRFEVENVSYKYISM